MSSASPVFKIHRLLNVISLTSTKNMFFSCSFFLTPLSAIFQLYHGDQFQWWKKPEYPERTTDHGQVTGKLYHLRLRVECTIFCNLQSRARTHAVLVIGLYELLGNPTTLLIKPPAPSTKNRTGIDILKVIYNYLSFFILIVVCLYLSFYTMNSFKFVDTNCRDSMKNCIFVDPALVSIHIYGSKYGLNS